MADKIAKFPFIVNNIITNQGVTPEPCSIPQMFSDNFGYVESLVLHERTMTGIKNTMSVNFI